jgi:TPR repeat protein
MANEVSRSMNVSCLSSNEMYEQAKSLMAALNPDVDFNSDKVQRIMGLFQSASDKGHPAATTELGHMYYARARFGEEGQSDIFFTKMISLFERATNLGDPQGTSELARCYLEGVGVGKDPRRAAELAIQAADLQDRQAAALLSSMYQIRPVSSDSPDNKNKNEFGLFPDHWVSEKYRLLAGLRKY